MPNFGINTKRKKKTRINNLSKYFTASINKCISESIYVNGFRKSEILPDKGMKKSNHKQHKICQNYLRILS